MLTYEDLDEVQRAVVLVAAEEGLPWEVLATWQPDVASRTPADVERTRAVAANMVEQGLVWMYRFSRDSNTDLTAEQVSEALGDEGPWDYATASTHDIALF